MVRHLCRVASASWDTSSGACSSLSMVWFCHRHWRRDMLSSTWTRRRRQSAKVMCCKLAAVLLVNHARLFQARAEDAAGQLVGCLTLQVGRLQRASATRISSSTAAMLCSDTRLTASCVASQKTRSDSAANSCELAVSATSMCCPGSAALITPVCSQLRTCVGVHLLCAIAIELAHCCAAHLANDDRCAAGLHRC